MKSASDPDCDKFVICCSYLRNVLHAVSSAWLCMWPRLNILLFPLDQLHTAAIYCASCASDGFGTRRALHFELPFGVWYCRKINALTPIGVPGGDGAGGGLVRHGDHGHEDGQQGGGRISAATAHCMSGKEEGGGRSDRAAQERSTSLLYPRRKRALTYSPSFGRPKALFLCHTHVTSTRMKVNIMTSTRGEEVQTWPNFTDITLRSNIAKMLRML